MFYEFQFLFLTLIRILCIFLIVYCIKKYSTRVASFQTAVTTIFLKTSLTLWIVEHYYQILLNKNSGWENREVPGTLAILTNKILEQITIVIVERLIEKLKFCRSSIVHQKSQQVPQNPIINEIILTHRLRRAVSPWS